jgi:hypothetical protein
MVKGKGEYLIIWRRCDCHVYTQNWQTSLVKEDRHATVFGRKLGWREVVRVRESEKESIGIPNSPTTAIPRNLSVASKQESFALVHSH